MLYYLARYKWRYLLGFVFMVGASVVVMLPPVIIRDAIDAIDSGTTRARLAAYFGLILVLALFEGGLRLASRVLISGGSRHVGFARTAGCAGPGAIGGPTSVFCVPIEPIGHPLRPIAILENLIEPT